MTERRPSRRRSRRSTTGRRSAEARPARRRPWPDARGRDAALVDTIDTRVLYSTSTDFTAPLFTQVGSVVNGSTATLFARTSDPAGHPARQRVLHAGRVSSWTFVTLDAAGHERPLRRHRHRDHGPEARVGVPGGGRRTATSGYTTDKGFLFISQNGDAHGPQVTIAAPIDNGVFTLGPAGARGVTAASTTAASRSCIGTAANGQNVDTSTLGPNTFTVTATDLSGNTTTVNRDLHGHLAVQRLLPAGRQPAGAESGERRPGDPGEVQPQWQPRACDLRARLSELAADPVRRQPRPSTSSSRRSRPATAACSYDAGADQYTYVWKTDKSLARARAGS